MKKFILGALTSTLFFSSPILALAQEEMEEVNTVDSDIFLETNETYRLDYSFTIQFVYGQRNIGSPVMIHKNEDIEAGLIAAIPAGYHFVDEVIKSIPYDELVNNPHSFFTVPVTIKNDPEDANYPRLVDANLYKGQYPIVVRGVTSDGETHVVTFDDLSGAPVTGGEVYISGKMINDKFIKDGLPYRAAENVKIRYSLNTEKVVYTDPLHPDKLRWAGLRNKEPISLTISYNTTNPSLEEESEEIFRLFNPSTKAHLFTKDAREKESLLASGQWNNEGYAWTAPNVSSSPVYRLFNPNSGEHHYTMDKNEYDTLVNYGWVGQNTAFYSADSGEKKAALYRLYNSKAPQAAQHHYTLSEEERDNLIKEGWSLEGTAWYGLSLN